MAGTGEGGVALIEHRGEPLEDMRDPRHDFERDRDIGFGGASGEPGGVVEEDFVRAGLDEQWWQASQVGEDRADEGRRPVAGTPLSSRPP